jgi:hypothetical protein
MRWECYVKYGRHWSYHGIREAQSNRGAALMTGYVAGRKVIGIRPEDSRDKIQVFRFRHVPDVHHGR